MSNNNNNNNINATTSTTTTTSTSTSSTPPSPPLQSTSSQIPLTPSSSNNNGKQSVRKKIHTSHRLEMKKALPNRNDHEKATLLAATNIERGSRMVKDLFTHFVFFIIFLVIVVLQRNSPYVYTINMALKNSFMFDEIPTLPYPKPYMGINNADDFKAYLTEQFGPVVTEMGMDNPHAMNKVIGSVVRLRQLRVTDHSCPTFGYDLPCYAVTYGTHTRETEPIIGTNGTNYYFTKDSHGSLVFGYNQYMYDTSGYYVDIPISNLTDGIQQLYDNDFFSENTRAVIISFVTLNLNYEARATVVYLLAEWTAAGSVDPYYTMRTYRIEMYNNAEDRFRAFLEITFLLFLTYYLYFFINEARIDYQLGRFRYFITSFWNILEVINLVLFIVSVILYLIFLGDNDRRTVTISGEEYPNDLEILGQTALVFYQLSAINILLLAFKTFRFLMLHRRLYALWITLAHAKVQLITFTTMFIIMMIGFLMSGWLTFGHEMDDYNGFFNSLGTSLQYIIGNPPSYADMQYTNRALGPIYNILFTIFMFFILINMFIAIISNSYQEIASSLDKKQKNKHKTMLSKWQRYGLSIKFLFRKNIYSVYDIVKLLMEKIPGLFQEVNLSSQRVYDEIQDLRLGVRYDEAQYYTDLSMKVYHERKKYLQEILQAKQNAKVTSGGEFELKLIGRSKIFKSYQMSEWLEEQEKNQVKMEKEERRRQKELKNLELRQKLDRLLTLLGDSSVVSQSISLHNSVVQQQQQQQQQNSNNNNNLNNSIINSIATTSTANLIATTLMGDSSDTDSNPSDSDSQ
ncbi:putative Ca2+ channel [Cavenderia fasciculata]|uniref:Ca2+ channel n=1 Tax=Cavenderia fasciculata TaxID=261658 RepID=F4PZ14_CACFS|nr:putative Ca2+ channel [Cavenderia fasciculata]EGG19043.1 putative Ca2+ channel [Cavenderia fasciculata]|eukprot:XP_004366676.1 putative Ca2+ channel [Cavenderia fasciculata]